MGGTVRRLLIWEWKNCEASGGTAVVVLSAPNSHINFRDNIVAVQNVFLWVSMNN